VYHDGRIPFDVEQSALRKRADRLTHVALISEVCDPSPLIPAHPGSADAPVARAQATSDFVTIAPPPNPRELFANATGESLALASVFAIPRARRGPLFAPGLGALFNLCETTANTGDLAVCTGHPIALKPKKTARRPTPSSLAPLLPAPRPSSRQPLPALPARRPPARASTTAS